MRKYSGEELQYADSTLRSYLGQGFSYHQAARKVAEQTRIYVNSLRWRAYNMAVKL